MKHCHLFTNQESAIGLKTKTPSVCCIKGKNKSLFIPKSAGDTIQVILDNIDTEFINYTLALPNNLIWYTSYNGDIVKFTPIYISNSQTNGITLVSNTYENNKGIMTFSDDLTFIQGSYEHMCEWPLFDLSNLVSMSLPDGLTTISYRTFNDTNYADTSNYHFTQIEIPLSVTKIGEYAFFGSKKLKTIIFKGTKTQWDAIEKGENWHSCYNNNTTEEIGGNVICSDGTITL